MFLKRQIASIVAAVLLAASAGASAVPLNQYASMILGFSSEYNEGDLGWSARQVLGLPNTTRYGDIASSWTSRKPNGALEWISVGFDEDVYATGATIRETYNNGFVYQVDVIDTTGKLHTVWSGLDTSTPGEPFDFTVSWATTPYQVYGLKVYIDSDHTESYEQIDAIRLLGDTEAPPVVPVAPVPEPASLALMGLGLLGLARLHRRARRTPGAR